MTLNLPDLPSGWQFTHLMFHKDWDNRPADWHVRATNYEDIADGWGDTILDAFEQLNARILNEDFWDLSYNPLPSKPTIDLQRLGLAKPVNIPRRKGL